MEKKNLWRAIWNPRMLICIFIGFSSGLPLYLLLQLVPAWLRRSEIDLKTIGLIGLVLMPYSWKFLWSPLCDRFVPPFMGRRRGWMLITQVLCFLSIATLGLYNPQDSLSFIIYLCFATAVFSASQDIVIDAYRRELLPDEELGFGNSVHVNAYRVAGLVPGGLGLILADQLSWQMVFISMAAFMLPGIICSFLISEPDIHGSAPKTLKQAIIEPFSEFFNRDGKKAAFLILAFMLLYKFGDTLATALITPFYIDLGFSNTEIGTVAKLVGFWSMIIGGFLGGLVMIKVGINRSLWLFGVVQLVSILGFAVLAEVGKNIWVLGMAVGFEYLGVGLGTAAFVSFIAKQTDKRFTATQFALFSSLFAIPRNFTGVIAGGVIEGFSIEWAGIHFEPWGYTPFFCLCAVLAIPGMVLLHWVAPWNEKT